MFNSKNQDNRLSIRLSWAEAIFEGEALEVISDAIAENQEDIYITTMITRIIQYACNSCSNKNSSATLTLSEYNYIIDLSNVTREEFNYMLYSAITIFVEDGDLTYKEAIELLTKLNGLLYKSTLQQQGVSTSYRIALPRL